MPVPQRFELIRERERMKIILLRDRELDGGAGGLRLQPFVRDAVPALHVCRRHVGQPDAVLPFEHDDSSDRDRPRDAGAPRQTREDPRETGAREHGEPDDDDRREARRHAQSVEAGNDAEQPFVERSAARTHRQPYGERGDDDIRRNAPRPDRERAERGEPDDDEAVEELALAAADDQQAAPRPATVRNAEVIAEARAEARELFVAANEAGLPLKPEVHQRNRRHDGDNDERGRQQIDRRPRAPVGPAGHLDGDDDAGRDRKEIEVIAVRQSEQDERRRERREPAARSGSEVLVQRP